MDDWDAQQALLEQQIQDLEAQRAGLPENVAALVMQEIERLRGELAWLEQRVRLAQQSQLIQQVQRQTGGLNLGQGNTVVVNGPAAGGDVHIHQAAPETLRLADLRSAYLNRLVESCGALSLAGIDRRTAALSESEARLNLGAVYTALLTLASEEREAPGREMEAGRSARRLSALALLDRQPRLALMGDPGSGKSTFVNFVALCLAGEALGLPEANLKLLTSPLPPEEAGQPETPQAWRHGALLPLRVALRDFAARGLPPPGEPASAKHLWEFVAAELRAAALEDFQKPLAQELFERGGLLLLDGLDEAPEAEQRRMQIKQAVEDFACTFKKCRILVTSRTYAYQKQDWRLNNFVEAVLAPFSQGQIERFVQRWYAHVGLLRGLSAEDAQGRAALLQRAILNSDRLLGLAERPLLLTLMASLHAWRGGTLPEKREELYADTVDLLLDWWESPKMLRDAQGNVLLAQPSLAEWLKVDRQKVRDLLNELAFKAHAGQPELQGTADIPEGELVSGLLRLSQNPDARPARLVEYLSTRAGLLLPRGVGVYTFPHRTFQEYLAACYLTDHEYPDQAAELACQEAQRWREVTLLAGAKAARGSASAIWTLADALCYHEPGVELEAEQAQRAQQGAFLAGQALAESASLEKLSERSQQKLERVQRWLAYILKSGALPAVDRARAGDTLAALGGLRFREELWLLPDEPLLGFVHIPAGPFLMGSDPKLDAQAQEDEQPQHVMDLPDYYIGRYPVTVAQYQVFGRAGGYAQARYWPEAQQAGFWQAGQFKGRYDDRPRRAPVDFGPPFNLPNHPVVGVSWYEALAYCRWLGEGLRRLGDEAIRRLEDAPTAGLAQQAFWLGLVGGTLTVALPSEAEWEKAARGPQAQASPYLGRGAGGEGGRIYPWGEAFDADRANTEETGIGSTSAVGCFPGGASPYGVLELSGNVWEWTRSLWGKDLFNPDFKYPYIQDEREDLAAGLDTPRVLRGGSFNDDASAARCAYRLWYYPNLRDRC